jgi:hypothetical protein
VVVLVEGLAVKWLDRSFINGPYLALVLSEKDYHRAMSAFKMPLHQRDAWIKNDHADATAHILEHPDRGMAVVVALRVREGIEGVQIAGLLVHEAVHAFQHFCERIGENRPSQEFEAYSIQAIAQRLMASYAEQTGGRS